MRGACDQSFCIQPHGPVDHAAVDPYGCTRAGSDLAGQGQFFDRRGQSPGGWFDLRRMDQQSSGEAIGGYCCGLCLQNICLGQKQADPVQGRSYPGAGAC